MAIGVRINSENLSGQTANVIFHSITGGTPIDLGIKTIPFNYYNELPYGEFVISSSTYDYTYTLTVSQPEGQNQNFIQMGNVSGETNYSIGVLNFNDFTAKIIDLGIDTGYWDLYDWYTMSESGSMIIFNNYADNARLVLFNNENGSVVEQYSAITTNWNYNSLDGRITYFTDNTNGVMYYYNGQSVFQYTFNPNVEYLNVQYDWNATCLDNTFIFVITNTGTTSNTSYRVSNDGSVIGITNWNSDTEYKYYGTYYPSNYFYEITILQIDDTILSFKIYDTSGNLVFNPGIASNTYNDWNYQWYGNQSFNMVLYNGGDNTIDYFVINYDCLNDNISSTSHDRVRYPNLTVNSEQLYGQNNTPVGGVFIIFYGNTNTYYSGGGYEVEYLDVAYKLENAVGFETYVFTNTGDFTKTFYMYNTGYKDFYTICSTGDSISSVFSITENGVKITQVGQNINDIGNTLQLSFNEYYQIINNTNSFSVANVSLFLRGDLIDTLTLNTSIDFSLDYQYKCLYLGTPTSGGYYINSQVTGYTPTGYYDWTTTSNEVYTQQYYFRFGNVVLFNRDTKVARVLTNDSLSNEFSLPRSYGNWDLEIGRDKFIYVYLDSSDNTRINLYNFNGALLNSTLVNIDGFNYIDAVKDRYVVVQTTLDGQRLLTMISDTDVKQITIDDQFINWTNINDYIWD